MSRPEIVEDVIAAAAAVPQALDRLSEEARAAWAGQLATDVMAERRAAGLSEPHPAPQPSAHPPVWDLVVHDMQERDAFGERKYGLRLRAFDGRSTLADAYQEALDLAVYLRKRLYEEQAPLPADVAEARRAAGITIAPEAALHRALQERTDELERARAECSELRQAVAAIEAAYDRVVSERDAVRSAIREMAVTVSDHDHNADMFDSGEEELASVRAVVEEFLRAQGHPVADEWATRRFAIPTAPDVALPCAPAAGAADPLRLSGLAAPRPLATWWPASDFRGPRP